MAPTKFSGKEGLRQYWLHDAGEYEYPVLVVMDRREQEYDTLVYLAPAVVKNYQDIQQLWGDAQEALWELWEEAHG